jgi:hypothetical protein
MVRLPQQATLRKEIQRVVGARKIRARTAAGQKRPPLRLAEKDLHEAVVPGYVFARLEPARKARVYQQDLLVRAIPVGNEPVFLRQLEDVKTICASGLEAVLHPLIKKGTQVRVRGGPLHGLEGSVDDPANPQGIVVSVDVLQQGLLVRLQLESLQLLN